MENNKFYRDKTTGKIFEVIDTEYTEQFSGVDVIRVKYADGKFGGIPKLDFNENDYEEVIPSNFVTKDSKGYVSHAGCANNDFIESITPKVGELYKRNDKPNTLYEVTGADNDTIRIEDLDTSIGLSYDLRNFLNNFTKVIDKSVVTTVDTSQSVDHPAHYNQGSIECIDALVAAHGKQATISFCIENAHKYIWRCADKNDIVEDLQKAVWYCNKAIELIKNDNQRS